MVKRAKFRKCECGHLKIWGHKKDLNCSECGALVNYYILITHDSAGEKMIRQKVGCTKCVSAEC